MIDKDMGTENRETEEHPVVTTVATKITATKTQTPLTRRDFLKSASIGALGLATVGVFGCTPKTSDTTAGEGGAITDAAGDGEPAAGGPGGPGGAPSGPVDRTAAKEAAKAQGRVFGYSGAGDWLGEKPSYTPTETIETDVLIIGSGHSGVQAALAAAEGGAKVTVVEKMNEGGFAWYGEDIGCFNSQFATDAGFGTWNLGEIVDEFVTRGGGRNNPGIVSIYVHNSGATLDHMLAVAQEIGIDKRAYTYDPTPEGWVIIQANHDYNKITAGEDIYDCMNKTAYPLTPGTKTWAGAVQFMGVYNDEPIQGVAANSVLPLIQKACIEKAQQLGAEWRYGSEAVILTQDEDGAVTGAIVLEGSDSEPVQINASKGVILCGGDYAGNADMCWALLNEYMERNEREGGLQADFFSFMGGRLGESVKLGCWANGMIEPAPRGCMLLGGGLGGPWGANAMLWLNSEGKRFCNEGNLTGAQTATARQATGQGFLVTDKKWMKSVCNSGIEHGGPNGGRPQYYQDMLDGMAAIVPGPDGGEVKSCTIAERGYSTVIAADTLDELAGYLGAEGDVKTRLLESIAHYNELCANGADSDFGKHPSAMIPVDEAPFYGIPGYVGNRSASPMMVTMSGLMTDLNLNVLNEAYEPIKGLYAAGNSLGGRYGTGYATPCAGNSIGMAVTHGRYAGTVVAQL
ncbi:MAG: FAD-binding protein [Coriobacteriales bacterium]|jgi:hypothetical protein|nr:FAD-binding protein [Coriobacteriales bacterium]